MGRAAAAPATCYQRTFHGRADQVSQVRRDVAACLDGCPAAADAILVASELATNAIVHSRSAGEFFTVRVELRRDSARVECEDLGGQWQCTTDKDRPHGLSIVDALAGPGNWGIDGDASGRVVWARLQW